MIHKTEATAEILDRLYEIVESRQSSTPEESYTAKLLASGTATIAQKLGEESIEAIIEAVKSDKKGLAEESSDLLYHLLVLWVDRGLRPQQVWKVLAGRFGISGISEKKSRGRE